MSDSLWPHGLQHARLPCPSLSPRVCSDSLLSHVWFFVTPWTAARPASLSFTISQSLLRIMSMSQWWHPTISPWAALFLFCLQSFPASGSFPVSRLFTSGGQTAGFSASASVLSVNIQSWFLLGLTSLISLLFKELSSLLQHHKSKASILQHYPAIGCSYSI